MTKDDSETGDSDDDETEQHTSDPVVNAIISLLIDNGVDTTGLTFDSTRFEKALVVEGDTKPIRDTLSQLKGKWNGKLKAWVFSKKKILRKVRANERRVNVTSTGTTSMEVETVESDGDETE